MNMTDAECRAEALMDEIMKNPRDLSDEELDILNAGEQESNKRMFMADIYEAV